MAEWFKALVLKTSVGDTTVGSNPTLSAINELCHSFFKFTPAVVTGVNIHSQNLISIINSDILFIVK